MAAVPPLSNLPTITHVTSHGGSITSGDGNLGGAGAVSVATDLGPQPGEVALGPGDVMHGLLDATHRFWDAANKWVADNPIGAGLAAYIGNKIRAAWQQNGEQIMQAVQKYGTQALTALTGLANGTLRLVGGVLEGVGGELVPPVMIDPQTLGGMNNIVAGLGGPGSPAAEAFAAGVSGVVGGFSGVG